MNKVGAFFKRHKNIFILSIAVVVVAALAFGATYLKRPKVDEPKEELIGCQPGFLFNINTGEPCPNAEDKTATPAAVTGYDAARKEYEGRSVVLDGNCTATPATLALKSGTRMLIANHSTKVLAVTFGNRTANLRPYHYMLNTAVAGDTAVVCAGNTVATVTGQ